MSDWCFLQNKYKQSGKKSMSSSLYAQLPQTAETQFAAKVSELQSEVNTQHTDRSFCLSYCSCLRGVSTSFFLCLLQNKYKEDGMKSLSQSLYSQLPETTETQLAKTVSELQSEVRNDWT